MIELDPVRADVSPTRAAQIRARAHAAMRAPTRPRLSLFPVVIVAITQLAWATLATLSIY